MLTQLSQQNNNYYITSRVPFLPTGYIPVSFVRETFNFSYQMTFAQAGEHRDHRTGGTHNRRNGEIFANTFQGKLAEFALYLTLSNKGIPVAEPDLSVFGLGTWDSVDLTINNLNLSIKSTKSFGNLLLLEENDWDTQANYIPNQKSYDYTFLVRMNPFCEDIMKRNRMLYSDTANMKMLLNIILSQTWGYDIPGYVTREDLIYIINNNFIIPRGAMLNGKTRMDASNYYVQSGDMKSMNSFISMLQI